MLGWVATSSSRGSSGPRDQAHGSCVSCIGRQVLYHGATAEAAGTPIPEVEAHSVCTSHNIAPLASRGENFKLHWWLRIKIFHLFFF